jgi:hypothetical protein
MTAGVDHRRPPASIIDDRRRRSSTTAGVDHPRTSAGTRMLARSID